MEVHVSKHVNAPIDITFNVFSDISKVQERIDGITKVEILSEITDGVGTRWRETRVMFGKEATEEMEISELRPNQFYAVVASSHGMNYRSTYTFTEKEGGTLVEMVFAGKPISWVAKLMTPLAYLLKNTTRKALEADLDSLKLICEQQVTQSN